MKNTNIITKNKDFASVFAVTAVVLMVPLVAMQFTSEVNWDHTDFIVMGILLISIGLLIVLASRKIKRISHRIIAIVALLASLLLIWAELAVGIFGTPFAGS